MELRKVKRQFDKFLHHADVTDKRRTKPLFRYLRQSMKVSGELSCTLRQLYSRYLPQKRMGGFKDHSERASEEMKLCPP